MRMLALIHQEESYRPLFKLLRLRSHEALLFDSGRPRETYCRFVNEGYLAVASDGEVSPCLALMRSYGCHILDHYKEIRRYSLGNIRKTSLKEIWEDGGYSALRSRVRAFEFSPALSLPSMIVIRSIVGTKKMLVYVSLVVGMSTITGLLFGIWG